MANACDLNARPQPSRGGLGGFPSIPGYTDAEAEEHAREVGVVPRPAETLNELDELGAFVRQANSLIQPFGSAPGTLRAEAGRMITGRTVTGGADVGDAGAANRWNRMNG